MSTHSNGPAARSEQVSGWIEAFLYVLCIALLSVAYAVALRHGAHTVVFILYSLVISAVALIAFTGTGNNATAIMLHPASWLVGIANMVVEGAYALLMGYVSPAAGSLMIRLSIPLTLVIGVVLFQRRPRPLAWFGGGIVALAVTSLLVAVEGAMLAPVLACSFACAVAVCVRAFSSEFHKWNRAAKTIIEKIQVTALVTLVTAVAGLVTVGALMAAVARGWLPQTPLLPSPADLVHAPTVLMSLLIGGALFTVMTYLSFSSVLKIRSENFIASSAFMPLAALLVQFPASAIGLIELPPFDWRLMPAMVAAIVGVLLMIWGSRRAA